MSGVAIIGQGYVGLALAREATTGAGMCVAGIGSDTERLAGLNNSRSHIDDLTDGDVAMLADHDRTSTDFAAIGDAEDVVMCVPTPLTRNAQPDLRPRQSAAARVALGLRRGTLVAVESTTYRETTDDVVGPMLEESGLVAGQAFNFAYSPERTDTGNSVYGLHMTSNC